MRYYFGAPLPKRRLSLGIEETGSERATIASSRPSHALPTCRTRAGFRAIALPPVAPGADGGLGAAAGAKKEPLAVRGQNSDAGGWTVAGYGAILAMDALSSGHRSPGGAIPGASP